MNTQKLLVAFSVSLLCIGCSTSQKPNANTDYTEETLSISSDTTANDKTDSEQSTPISTTIFTEFGPDKLRFDSEFNNGFGLARLNTDSAYDPYIIYDKDGHILYQTDGHIRLQENGMLLEDDIHGNKRLIDTSGNTVTIPFIKENEQVQKITIENGTPIIWTVSFSEDYQGSSAEFLGRTLEGEVLYTLSPEDEILMNEATYIPTTPKEFYNYYTLNDYPEYYGEPGKYDIGYGIGDWIDFKQHQIFEDKNTHYIRNALDFCGAYKEEDSNVYKDKDGNSINFEEMGINVVDSPTFYNGKIALEMVNDSETHFFGIMDYSGNWIIEPFQIKEEENHKERKVNVYRIFDNLYYSYDGQLCDQKGNVLLTYIPACPEYGEMEILWSGAEVGDEYWCVLVTGDPDDGSLVHYEFAKFDRNLKRID